jgi:putative nucleotidyltransferase with HDIG domain
MDEGMSLVFTRADAAAASESIVTSGIKTAICAPLTSLEKPFGIIQLDIRGTSRGTFSKKDVDRIAVFGHHVALVLDNHRLHLEQKKAFESTINALVHSLSLKDPNTATHSVRVRDVAVKLGLKMGLTDTQIESLRVAALLHDMGKHGVRDEVLLKPGRLSDEERVEMMEHTELTQNILDQIFYPAHLKDVPQLAAYHHEKMNGSGPFRIPGNAIPIQSRIISVADAFDALVSARVYKKPLPPEQALTLLDQGKDLEWDGEIVDCLRTHLEEIQAAVYVNDDHRKAA